MPASREIELALYDAALNVSDPATRQTFLAKACAGDDALRTRLEQLLEVDSPAEEFFQGATGARTSFSLQLQAANGPVPPPGDQAPVLEGAPGESPGTRIGRYKLLKRIGEGGCGVVYAAEQEEPVRRRVALKVIRAGMDTENVIARFERERQALALMDHPNIAHVLDAGATDTGRPFFVMELVQGTRITVYCNENRLDIRRRLELFIQVCHAIQHAHQKGVVHRDVKPSNILVALHDGAPVPKVIDFGIAKATEGRLADDTMFTACDQFIGTPAYMSPEQAELGGVDADTRSDVYSLGVLLYELLTGRTPFDNQELIGAGLDAMRRTLREVEPKAPSAALTSLAQADLSTVAAERHLDSRRLVATVSGDLDWIVLQTLEKDRQRRYKTVNGLASDLQRFLDDQPVTARPPSRLYLFKKFVRRNKGVFAVGVMVVALLVAGLGTSSWLLLKERRAHQEAEAARKNEARLLQQSKAREVVSQAAMLLSEGKTTEADALLGQTPLSAIEPSPEADSVFRSLGEWNAISGRWKQSADCYRLYIQASRMDRSLMAVFRMLGAAPAFLEAGDVADYIRLREEALARFVNNTNFGTSEVPGQLIKVTLLLPADPALLKRLQPLAALVARSTPDYSVNPGLEAYAAAFRAMSLGLLAYRQGNFPEALQWNLKCLSCSDTNQARSAAVHAISAMAAHRLGQPDLARSELEQSRDFFNAPFALSYLPRGEGQGLWLDWAIARSLQREAAALIEPASRLVQSPP